MDELAPKHVGDRIAAAALDAAPRAAGVTAAPRAGRAADRARPPSTSFTEVYDRPAVLRDLLA